MLVALVGATFVASVAFVGACGMVGLVGARQFFLALVGAGRKLFVRVWRAGRLRLVRFYHAFTNNKAFTHTVIHPSVVRRLARLRASIFATRIAVALCIAGVQVAEGIPACRSNIVACVLHHSIVPRISCNAASRCWRGRISRADLLSTAVATVFHWLRHHRYLI